MTNTLNIKGTFYYIAISPNLYAVVNYVAIDYNTYPMAGNITVQIDPNQAENPSASIPLFNTPENAVNYFGASQAAIILAAVNDPITPYYTAYNLEFVDPEELAALIALQAQIPTKLSQLTNDSGYITTSALSSYVTSTSLSSTLSGYATNSALSGKQNTITTGSTSQYFRGDLSLATFPAIPAAQIQSDWNQTNTSSLDFIKNKPSIPSTARTSSTLTLSLVGTGATGTQIHATKDSTVRVCVSTSATASISGAAVSTVTIKICSTNSSTEANWTSVATSETSQSYSLAVAIQGVTGMKEQIEADVPGGWYVKLVNSGSGTHSEAFVSGQQTIYG